MKSIRKNFKNYLLVKPLYKKVKPKNKVGNGTICNFNYKDSEPGGHGINLKRNVIFHNDGLKEISVENTTNITSIKTNRAVDTVNLDLRARNNKNKVNNELNVTHNVIRDNTMDKTESPIELVIDDKKKKTVNTDVHNDNTNNSKNKIVSDDNTAIPANTQTVPSQDPDSWLRVYPARRIPGEKFCSTVYRYLFCQIGLMIILVLWTIIWFFIIRYIEEPHEIKVMEEFEREQRQLIIDLATELRQITPLSPKWRAIIEKRIEQEQAMTIKAVGRGARLHPGYFWDAAGTFLFLVYVMTCLGFGAPVPQTVGGRCASVIYAAGAVPTQLFLMMNTSKLIVAKVVKFENFLATLAAAKIHTLLDVEEKSTRSIRELISYNLNIMKIKLKQFFACVMQILCIGHCIPIAISLYYTLGAMVFGLARGRTGLELVLFPLEFTTTGGLERVIGYVRTLYAFYVEGAMSLLAWALATFRKHSENHLANLIDRLRLVKRDDVSVRDSRNSANGNSQREVGARNEDCESQVKSRKEIMTSY